MKTLLLQKKSSSDLETRDSRLIPRFPGATSKERCYLQYRSTHSQGISITREGKAWRPSKYPI